MTSLTRWGFSLLTIGVVGMTVALTIAGYGQVMIEELNLVLHGMHTLLVKVVLGISKLWDGDLLWV